jgi:hypothetical protein
MIIGARRPLTIEEMAMALGLALSKNSRTTAKIGLAPEGLDRKIRQSRRLFAFIKNSTLYLIHQTAREYLIDDNVRNGDKWLLRLTDTETLMSKICINYLLLDEMQPSQGPEGQKQMHPFYDYTSTYWGQHARIAALSTANFGSPA